MTTIPGDQIVYLCFYDLTLLVIYKGVEKSYDWFQVQRITKRASFCYSVWFLTFRGQQANLSKTRFTWRGEKKKTMLFTASLPFLQAGILTKPQSDTQLLTSSQNHGGGSRLKWRKKGSHFSEEVLNNHSDIERCHYWACNFVLPVFIHLVLIWFQFPRGRGNKNWASTASKHHFLVSQSHEWQSKNKTFYDQESEKSNFQN